MSTRSTDRGEEARRATPSVLFHRLTCVKSPILRPAVSVSFDLQFRCRVTLFTAWAVSVSFGGQFRCRVTDGAICSLLFMAGMHRSEDAALTWSCVREGNDDNTLLIEVRESKMIQESELDLRLVKNGAAKAMHELRELRELQGKANDDDRVICFTSKSINLRFKAACQAAGVEGRLTAHSGRIGLASELVTRGANTGAVALAGGWRSESMVLHYSKKAGVEQGAVAKYF